MLTTERLIEAISCGVDVGPMQEGVSRLQSAPLNSDTPEGVMILIRTAPKLSAHIASCTEDQYSMYMLPVLMAGFFGVVPHYGNGDVALGYNELIALVMLNIDTMRRYGFRVEGKRAILHAPYVVRDALRVAMDIPAEDMMPYSRRLGTWGVILATTAWLGSSPKKGVLGIQYVFLPDVPTDDLTDAHYEHAIRVSHGWNLSGLYTKDRLKAEVANLRRAHNEAVTFKTF